MGEMTTPHASGEPADHAAHDHYLVAALADRTDDALDPDTAALAREQVATCSVCAALHADLVALAAAMPTSAVPPRPRDFSLTPADADRLRAGGWRRWFGFFGSPRDAFSRPLALGLTTLGIAGLLVANVPGAVPGLGAGATSGVAAPAVTAEAMPFGAAESAAPAAEPFATEVPAALGAAPSPDATEDLFSGQGYDTSGGSDTSGGGDTGGGASAAPIARDNAAIAEDGAPVRDDASGLSALVVVAGAMLIAGLGLFLLRWTGRRLSG